MKMKTVLEVLAKLEHIEETRHELDDIRLNGRIGGADDEALDAAVDLLGEYAAALKAIKVAE